MEKWPLTIWFLENMDFKNVIFNLALLIVILRSYDDVFIWIQRMLLMISHHWCHQATSHYLNQCWPSPLSSYGFSRPQWVSFGVTVYPMNYAHTFVVLYFVIIIQCGVVIIEGHVVIIEFGVIIIECCVVIIQCGVVIIQCCVIITWSVFIQNTHNRHPIARP